MKMRIYVAGPLFSDAELHYNEQVNEYLERRGYATFLPQRDGKKLVELLQAGESKEDAMKTIFSLDVEEIRRSDILLIILDGRVPDEGACVELGIAYALNKTCIGLKTGPRHLMDNLDNPLITGAIQGKVARTIAELEQFI
ncbi:nucleoside 2-deoxyribosyltransferase [Methanosphaerula subterraneus]|uniref:nucleoside 2-deoxyribosyltransferase n=1 Tax=Methanosphaerula subterraneus TaxID=3350244 RepID=UPI003F826113